ncbi:MAG: DUF1127 domain-containing protein [Rhizobium sp.]|nr:DUF1127 domain-containing protein [Rhizobium sp.]
MTMIAEGRARVRPLTASGILSLIAGRISAYRESRRILGQLAGMEDHILEDIGLTRFDVVQASVAEIGIDRMDMLDRARTRRMR